VNRHEAQANDELFAAILALMMVIMATAVFSVPSLHQNGVVATLLTLVAATVATVVVHRVAFGPAPTRPAKEQRPEPDAGDDFVGTVMMLHGAIALGGFILFLAIMSLSARAIAAIGAGTPLLVAGALGVLWLGIVAGVIELVFVRGVDSPRVEDAVLTRAFRWESRPKARRAADEPDANKSV